MIQHKDDEIEKYKQQIQDLQTETENKLSEYEQQIEVLSEDNHKIKQEQIRRHQKNKTEVADLNAQIVTLQAAQKLLQQKIEKDKTQKENKEKQESETTNSWNIEIEQLRKTNDTLKQNCDTLEQRALH